MKKRDCHNVYSHCDTHTMPIDIVFDESDLEDEDEDSVISDDLEGSDVPDEKSSDEDDGDGEESVSFESDQEEEEDDEEEDEECGDEIDIGEDADKGGIDLSEFYDETSKKSAKAIFNKRKRSKPPKVAKAKRTKKKKGVDNIVIPNYLVEDVREKTLTYLSKFTSEKNAKVVERTIYNHTLRSSSISLGRPVRKTDLEKNSFKKRYTTVSYEIISSISKGAKCKDSIKNIEDNKISLYCDSFKNEHFNDTQETSNIENPPKVMRGIHTCSVCIKDKNREDDPDRGKRVDWYQQQTRSCDEPMTVFVRCTDCGKKWKF